MHAGCFQELIKRRVREMRRQLDRRNVSAARERVGRADRSEKFAIEIFRIVIAETARRVGQDRQRMNQALLECERVNERLERGTRRARTARAIDLAVDVDLVEIGGTDLRTQ